MEALMRVDIWWHAGPGTVWQDGHLLNLPVLGEPEHSYLSIDLESDDLSAVPPLPDYPIAWCDPHVTVRYPVIPIGGPAAGQPAQCSVAAALRRGSHPPAQPVG